MKQLRHANCKGPQPTWMIRLRVGDVIAPPTGVWRVVRGLSRYANGDLRAVTCVIRHCSWTGRCYTVIGANDLKQLGYRRIPVKPRRLRKGIDRTIAAAITQPAGEPFILKCCDVDGIA